MQKVIDIPESLCYILDRGFYEQEMAKSNLVFMLNLHINDLTDEFLKSECFCELQDDLINAMAKSYGIQKRVILELTGSNLNNYKLDTINGKLTVLGE